MRIDFIGCKSGEKLDCNDNGDSYGQYGSSFTVDCPAGCDKVTPVNVWGRVKF